MNVLLKMTHPSDFSSFLSQPFLMMSEIFVLSGGRSSYFLCEDGEGQISLQFPFC